MEDRKFLIVSLKERIKQMSIKTLSLSLFLVLIFLFIPPSTFGRSIITGQVVDAETGQPIENAAVFIYWSKVGEGPPGLAGWVDVEKAETLTNSEGYFKIPKYSTWLKSYELAIYRQGYVCWDSKKIFPTWEDRKDFKLKNKMVIKLEKFKEEYSREEHARFTIFSSIAAHEQGVFHDAIKSENELFGEIFRRK